MTRTVVHLAGEPFALHRWDGTDPGDSLPPLHIAHATGFNGPTYGPLAELLAAHFSVSAWDARGHGSTEARADPEQLRSWETLALDLERLLEHLASSRGPVVAAGHSLGAVLSVMVAARRPDLVRSLVLLDPTLFPPRWALPIGLIHLLGQGKRIPIAARAARRRAVWPDRATLLSAYRGKRIFAGWDERFLHAYLEHGTHERPDGQVELSCAPAWESRIFATTPGNVWRHLRRIRCPLLVIHGGRSDVFLPASARALSKRLPDAELTCFEEASHFVPMEEPDGVAGRIVEGCAS